MKGINQFSVSCKTVEDKLFMAKLKEKCIKENRNFSGTILKLLKEAHDARQSN